MGYISNMNGIRVDLDLSAFFTDIRKFSRVYLNYHECLAIKDVEEHIKKTFSITEKIVLFSDKYLLPSSQSINILQPSEHIRVIRGDTVLHDESAVLYENAVPCVNGNNMVKSYCAHSTPCCTSEISKCEGSELYSGSCKRRRDVFDTDIDISSGSNIRKVIVQKKDKREKVKQRLGMIEVLNHSGSAYEYTEETRNDRFNSNKNLKEKIDIFSVNGKNETWETIGVKKNMDYIPTDEDALQQSRPVVSDIVVSEITQDEHINYLKRKKKKLENDANKESLDNIQTKIRNLNDAKDVETKHKKKITEYAASCKNIDSTQPKLNTLINAGEVETKYKKKISSEVCNSSNQTELSTKNDDNIDEIEVCCVSDSKYEDTTDAELVMQVLKKSNKRIRKRKPKHKKYKNLNLCPQSAKMLYENIRAVSEKEMITAAEALRPEVKQNVHIFFDDDLGDSMLSITVGEEPHITEPLQTSNQNVTASGDGNPEENLLPPASIHHNIMLPLDSQDTAANQNVKCDSDNDKPDAEITSLTEDSVNLKLQRALARAKASLNSICPEIAKVKGSASGIDKNKECEETSDNLLNSNLLMLINNIKEKPPVFERKKKASEAEHCQENIHQLPLIKNNDHDYLVRDGLEKIKETRESEVQSVKSSAKFDINAYPVVDKFNPGDAILFKTLQLNKSYEPVVSDYIFGKILEVFGEKGSLKMEILRGLHEFKDLPPGKFSIYDDTLGEEENSNSHIKEIECNRIVEPRLLYP